MVTQRLSNYSLCRGNTSAIKTPPNTACTRLVGVGAFSSRLRGLELVPLKWRYLVSPTSG